MGHHTVYDTSNDMKMFVNILCSNEGIYEMCIPTHNIHGIILSMHNNLSAVNNGNHTDGGDLKPNSLSGNVSCFQQVIDSVLPASCACSQLHHYMHK